MIEGLPAGYLAEANFRVLNLGDKPFRGGAGGGRLTEIFDINERGKVSDAKKITDPTKKEKRLKYLTDTYDVRLRQFKANPDSESMSAARTQGDIATFAQSTALSRWITSLEQKVMGKSDKTPNKIANQLMKLLKITNLPYVKVPINITTLAIEMSCPPINAIKMVYDMKNGTRRDVMNDIGKLVISSALTGVAMSLASSGVITTLSDDKNVRAAQMKAGVEEGRINIDGLRRLLSGENPAWQDGDRSWSIKRLGIVSVQLMAIAQAYKDKTPEEIAKMREGGMFDNFFTKMYETNIGMAQYVPQIALQQSILSGTNTLFQALLGGEMEKDKWLTSQAQVLSSIIEPNTVAAISQTFDPQRFIRETRDVSGDDKIKKHIINTFKDRMFMDKGLPAKIDIWGEPILRIPKGENWTYNLFGITKEKKYQKYSFGTHLLELYNEYSKNDPDGAKGIIPSLPSSSTKVGWDDAKMTPKELEQYQTIVGRTRAQDAEAFVNSQQWAEAELDDKVKGLASIYSRARRDAEARMFSWNNFKDKDPQSWATMLDKDALPMPSMVSQIEKTKLDPVDTKTLNEIALKYYAEDIMPYLNGDQPSLERDKKDINEKTGKSYFVEELNTSWRKALKDAKEDMVDILEKKPTVKK